MRYIRDKTSLSISLLRNKNVVFSVKYESFHWISYEHNSSPVSLSMGVAEMGKHTLFFIPILYKAMASLAYKWCEILDLILIEREKLL